MEELEDGKIKFPFSGFDLFWYIIPGSVLLLNVFLFEFWVKSHYGLPTLHSPVYTAFTSTANEIFTKNWVFSAIYLLVLLSMAYVCGHILASIGSFFIERILVGKGYKYPYEHLLKLTDKNCEVKSHSGPYYRGIFFWLNMYFIIRYTNIFYDYYIISIFIKMLSYYLLALIFSKPLFDFFKYKLPKHWKWLDKNRTKKYISLPHNIFVFFFESSAVFYNLLSNTFSIFLNTRKSFDKEFIEKYKETFKNEFTFDPNISSNNNYWLSKLSVINSSSALAKEVQVWESMYRFSRNLSTAFFISFFYCFISIITQASLMLYIKDPVVTFLPVIFFVLAITMLFQFFYLYDNRYSRLVFRSFVLLKMKK